MNYKYLSEKDREKMQLRKKISQYIGKITKWIAVFAVLAIIFVVGAISFYTAVDHNDKAQSPGYNTTLEESKAPITYFSGSNDKDFEHFLERNQAENTNTEQSNILADSIQENRYDFSNWNKSCPPELIIVNFNNNIDENYKVDMKLCRGKEVSSLASDKLEEMIQAAAKDGITLWISSGYRSIQYQEKLFNYRVQNEELKGYSKSDAEKLAQNVVAKPGLSEHHTGLAVDFNSLQDDFYTTKEYKWLMDNAEKFGFIERYQSKWKDKTGVIFEPWHFRYVGEYAKMIKESNLCLEDYIKQNFI